MNFLVSADTDAGRVKKTNEDSFHVRVCRQGNSHFLFAVICDGMGGLSRGELASATLVDAFMRWADERLVSAGTKPVTAEELKYDWTRILQDTGSRIMSYARSRGISMGTTATAMLMDEKTYFILHVGDTRVYEIGRDVRVLTRDQTLVQREIDMGRLTPQQAKADPRRSVLLQCVGASQNILPDALSGPVRPECVYMLCSDGFRHEISEQEIQAYLGPESARTPAGMKENIRALIDLDMQRQERDNISAICVRTY